MGKKKVFTLLLIGFLIASCAKPNYEEKVEPIYKETILKGGRILEASASEIAKSSANLREYMKRTHNFELKRLKEGVYFLTLKSLDTKGQKTVVTFGSGFSTKREHALFRIFCKAKNGKLMPDSYFAGDIWLCLKDGKIRYAIVVKQTAYYLEGEGIKEIPYLIKKFKLIRASYVKLFETKEAGLKGIIIVTSRTEMDIHLKNEGVHPISVCPTSDYIIVTDKGKQYRFKVFDYHPKYPVTLNPEDKTSFHFKVYLNRIDLQDNLQAIGILNYSIPPKPCTNGKGLLFFFKKEGWVVHTPIHKAVLEKLMEEGLYNLPGPFIEIAW